MSPLVYSVTEELWEKSVDSLKRRIETLQAALKRKPEPVAYAEEEDACCKMSPCSPSLWHRDIGYEHDQHTCYFRRLFTRVDGQARPRKTSHQMLMRLVRSCVWQALLAEFITGKLCGRDAVRLRVEDELEHNSTMKSGTLRREAGMAAQDFFNLVKHHLHAATCPLNRAGLGSAEKLVIDLPGYDCRSKRKGWSNRKMRTFIARALLNGGIKELSTRREQEAEVWRRVSSSKYLKESAPKAVLKILLRDFDPETGEVTIKPWSKEELSEIRREARQQGTIEKVSQRAELIRGKLKRGEQLTRAETCFKSRNKHLFLDCAAPKRGRKLAAKSSSNEDLIVAEQNAKRKRKHSCKKDFDMQQFSKAKSSENPMKFPKNPQFFPQGDVMADDFDTQRRRK